MRDLCTGYGLLPPDLTQHTDARLRLLLPGSASVGAVVDATAAASPEQLRLTLDALADDPGVDAVVAMLEPRFHLGTSTIQAMLEEVSAGHPRTTFIGGLPLRRGRTSRRVPFADAPDGAVRALAHGIDRQPARRRGRFLAEPARPPLGLSHRLADLVVADARGQQPGRRLAPSARGGRAAARVRRRGGADGGCGRSGDRGRRAQMLPFPVVLTAHLTQQPADPPAGRRGDRAAVTGGGAGGRAAGPGTGSAGDLHVFDLQHQLHQGPCLRVMGDRPRGLGRNSRGGHGPAGAVTAGARGGPPATTDPSAGLPDVRGPQWALAPVGGSVEATELVRGGADGLRARGPDAVVRGRDRAGWPRCIARVSVLLGGRCPRSTTWSWARSSSTASRPSWRRHGCVSGRRPPRCGAAPAPNARGRDPAPSS